MDLWNQQSDQERFLGTNEAALQGKLTAFFEIYPGPDAKLPIGGGFRLPVREGDCVMSTGAFTGQSQLSGQVAAYDTSSESWLVGGSVNPDDALYRVFVKVSRANADFKQGGLYKLTGDAGQTSVTDDVPEDPASVSSQSEEPCDPVVIAPNSDNVITNITVAGIPCSQAEPILFGWGRSGYPGKGPPGFVCEDAGRPMDLMTQSTGLRCSLGTQVITFGGGSAEAAATEGALRCEDTSIANIEVFGLESNAVPCDVALDVVTQWLDVRDGEVLPTGFACTEGPLGASSTPVNCVGEGGSEVVFAFRE